MATDTEQTDDPQPSRPDAERYRVEVRSHRVMETDEADAVLTVVGGPAVEMWRTDPGARQIAYVDRTSAQQAGVPAGSGTAVFLTAPGATG